MLPHLDISATAPIALGITIGLYVYWLIVGYALHSALGHRITGNANLIRSVLLAPVSGFALTLFGVFSLNHFGLPVKSCGVAWSAGLLIMAGIIYWKRRPPFPRKEFLKYSALFLLSLALTAWPMAEYGIWWLSYCNDDMANYCLAAQRHFSHGFFDVPAADTLASGTENSLFYWFMHVPEEMRPGSEIHLAWVMSITGLSAHQIFMPLIVALQLALISATCAIVAENRVGRKAGLWLAFGLACSAQITLGTTYQLIAQVSGIGLLISSLTLCSQWCNFTPPLSSSRFAKSGRLLLASLVVSVLLFDYSEVFPFLILSLALYALMRARKISDWQSVAKTAGSLALIVIIFLNVNLFNTLDALSYQSASGLQGLKDVTVSIFPFYLIPSGFGNLWGLIPVGKVTSPLGTTAPILLGIALTLLLIWACIKQLFSKMTIVACFCFVSLVLGAKLFIGVADFGLFKLSMYSCPLFTAMVVTFLVKKRSILTRCLLFAILISPLYVQFMYVLWSRGESGTLAEIRKASGKKMNLRFSETMKETQGTAIVDAENIVLAKFMSAHNEGVPIHFLTQNYFGTFVTSGALGRNPFLEKYRAASREIHEVVTPKMSVGAEFTFRKPDGSETKNKFTQMLVDGGPSLQDKSLVVSNGFSLYNAYPKNSPVEKPLFVSSKLAEVNNHLIFISSKLGQPYYTTDRKVVSFYQFEPDIEFPGAMMAGIGRHHLLEIINPTEKSRFVISLTATLKANGENRLPPCEIYGVNPVSAGFVGRGSARIFPQAPAPQVINTRSYYGIDMGVDGTLFPSVKSFLMRWYGADVPFDNRRLVAFARDFSMISAANYQNLKTPSSLQRFPLDLIDDNLEYSGIYEDGWIAEEAFVVLSPIESERCNFHLDGFVPVIPGRNWPQDLTLRVLVDGKKIAMQRVQTGDFAVDCPMPGSPTKRRIDVRISASLPLPAPDNRPVSAKLRFVGFTNEVGRGPLASTKEIVDPSNIDLNANWDGLEKSGDESFRWLANDAGFTIHSHGAASGLLKLSIESGPGAFDRGLHVAIIDKDGTVLAERDTQPRHDLAIPLHFAATNDDQKLSIHLTGPINHPNASDPRILNARVFSLSWSPQP